MVGSFVNGRSLVRIALVVTGLLLVLFVLRVPMRFDATDVTELQLNSGSLRLENGDEAELTARVPVAFAPFLMVNQSGGTLEVGVPAEATEAQVMLWGLIPLGRVPASVVDADWELRSNDVESVSIEAGAFVADRYEAESLTVFAMGGKADLRAVDIGTIALFAQPRGEVVASGNAERLSVMDAEGEIDYDALKYESYDSDIIMEMIEHQ
jgi:hypothetical protein